VLPQGQVDHFLFQNEFLQSASGIHTEVWDRWKGQHLSITASGATLQDTNTNSAYTRYTADPGGGTVTYTFTAWRDGELCLDMHLGKNVTFNVYKVPKGAENGSWLFYEGYKLTEMVHCGTVSTGDKIRVVIPVGANEASSMIVRGAILNDEVYRHAYSLLSMDTMKISQFSNTYIKGHVSVVQDGLLYTSIPQDGHWVAYVDGQKAESTLVGGVMVAVPLTEGDHTVEFRYENASVTLGIACTLLGATGFAAVCFFRYGYPKIKKRKEVA
jgi:hypothetical protein